jgi:hypothetical protein
LDFFFVLLSPWQGRDGQSQSAGVTKEKGISIEIPFFFIMY